MRLDRRGFIKGSLSAAGGLSISVSWPGHAAGHAVVNAFVSLHADGHAEVTVSRSEMGQGIWTALTMLVAEELDLPLERIQVRQADADAGRYGNQATGGSASIRTRFLAMRQAGAAARAVLVNAAAHTWQVSPIDCQTADGSVLHPSSGRQLPYGDLVGELESIDVPADPPLKRTEDFRIVGKPHRHLDIATTVRGQTHYGIDTQRPGMTFAAIARCPVFGGGLAEFDSRAALAVPGVKQVIAVPGFPGNAGVAAGVAVVAANSWAALQGRDALRVRWQDPEGGIDDDATLTRRIDALLDAPPEDMIYRHGEPERTVADAAQAISATYTLPFLAHAAMEPMNCTASFANGRLELWSPTQTPNFSAALVASALGLEPSQVHLHVTRMGGAFGRRLNADFSVEAAWLARESGQPVKVVWSREDDLQHDFYRPRTGHRLTAVLDEGGWPQAWVHQLASPAIFSRYALGPDSKRPGLYEAVGAADMPYRTPNRSCGFSQLPSAVPLGWWRAVSTTHTVFAVESFIDELANAAGIDPLAYRLELIDELPAEVPLRERGFPFEPERMLGVLTAAARAADWQRERPRGRGLGIACSWDHLSYAAQVVEVSLRKDGGLRIHQVVSSIDCGLVINPEGVRAQVEGSVMQGLSAALHERITLAAGRVEQQNFHDYPVLRQADIPDRIEVRIISSGAPPTGAGEPALPAVAPALANAVFAATGMRLRSLPLDLKTLNAG